MSKGPGPYDLETERVIFTPGFDVVTKTVTPMFYPELDSEFSGFKGHVLIQHGSFSEPWDTWEIHPHGDEFVYLIEGDVEFVLQRETGEEAVRLNEAGQYVVVPRNTWHTARPNRPSKLLFVTPGEGTDNQSEPTNVTT